MDVVTRLDHGGGDSLIGGGAPWTPPPVAGPSGSAAAAPGSPRDAAASAGPDEDAFPVAFAAAIAASGMSLDALRAALEDRGHRLSVATLSYWRSGRRRPERASSMAALGELEQVLGLPGGSLIGLLPSRSVDGVGLEDLYRLNGTNRAIAGLIARLGLDYDEGMDRLSVQDLLELDRHGHQVRHRMRMVVRAHRDGADRFPLTLGVDTEGSMPTIRSLLGCRIGRSLVSDDGRLQVAEAILDRALAHGEAALVEIECVPERASTASTRWERGILRALPLYLVCLTFDPGHMPTSVERFERAMRTEQVRSAPVLVTSSSVSVLFTDLNPGVAGVTWRW